MRLAFFASGTGSNVQAILNAIEVGNLEAEPVCLFCDQPGAGVLEKAEKANLPYLVLRPKDCMSRLAWEEAILDFLAKHQVDLIILAGFMRIISSTILTKYEKRVLNIHPSLLPQFPGRHGIRDAFEAKVERTGVTIHYVDEGIDTGEIVAQESIEIESNWTLADLEKAIHQIEHRVYPATIQMLVEKGQEN